MNEEILNKIEDAEIVSECGCNCDVTSEATDKSIVESLGNRIPLKPIEYILVKPLEVETIVKTVKEPISKGMVDKKTHAEKVDFKEVTKEFPSQFRKGVVLAIPEGNGFTKYNLGDTIIYKTNAGIDFDLFKDSQLVKFYDIVGIWVK